MRANIFVLAAVLGLAAAQCDQTHLTTCLTDVENNVINCKDVACICNYLKVGLGCYSTYCPSITLPSDVTDNYNAYCSSGALPTQSFVLPTDSFVFPSETTTLVEPTLTPTSTRSTRMTSSAAPTTVPTTAPTTAPTTVGTLSTITSTPTLLGGGAQTTGTSVRVLHTSTITSRAAAEVLLVPAGGLVAGLVGVLAWL